jgi:protein TonB
MILRLVVALLFCECVFAQSENYRSCGANVVKSGGANGKVRVSTGVTEALIEKAYAPVTSDLDKKLKSTVVVVAIIDKTGVVRCAEAVRGDPSLFQRSSEAALKWRFKPYVLNGEPVVVDTQIEFDFSKRKVKAR